MTSVRRKIKRAKKKKAKKQLKQAASFYLDLPDSCMSCDRPFDKTSKEDVTTWSIVVRRAENKKNLYCPECWDNAKKIIADVSEHISKQSKQEQE